MELLYDRYENIKVLSEAEGRRVVLCLDTETKQKVIVKEHIENASLYKQIKNIDCPYLPKIILVKELGEDDYYVVEEHIDGSSLEEWRTKNICKEKQVRSWMLQLLEALKVLHNENIIHRDIKPDNVILRKNGTVVLIDYSAAREYKADSAMDTICLGTGGYAAPEQYGVQQSDKRTDFYGLGALANVLLTNEFPSEKIWGGSLSKVILKCTEVNMNQRYQTEDELIKDIKKSIGASWVKNKKLLWLSCSIVLVMAGIVGMWFVKNYHIESGSDNGQEIDGNNVIEEINSENDLETTEQVFVDFSYDWEPIYYRVCSRLQEEWPDKEFLYVEVDDPYSVWTSNIMTREEKQVHVHVLKETADRMSKLLEDRLFNYTKEIIESNVEEIHAVGLELKIDGEDAIFTVHGY